MIGKKIPVLDKGFVQLIDAMPRDEKSGDEAIVNAARTSYGEGTKSIRDNRNLIRYLLRNEHTSPFEMVEFKFLMKIPIFVARQHVRHRTASLNEYSGRYSIMMDEFYLPDIDNISEQSISNKQGRENKPLNLSDFDKENIWEIMKTISESTYDYYEHFINEKNLARELARIILPVNYYTKIVWKINLHNLLRYLKLRMDLHAQYEIRKVAEALYELIKPFVPLTVEAFEDYVLNAKKFSKQEFDILIKFLDREKIKEMFEHDNINLSQTEKREFLKKLNL